jgi:hypothetical protein
LSLFWDIKQRSHGIAIKFQESIILQYTSKFHHVCLSVVVCATHLCLSCSVCQCMSVCQSVVQCKKINWGVSHRIKNWLHAPRYLSFNVWCVGSKLIPRQLSLSPDWLQVGSLVFKLFMKVLRARAAGLAQTLASREIRRQLPGNGAVRSCDPWHKQTTLDWGWVLLTGVAEEGSPICFPYKKTGSKVQKSFNSWRVSQVPSRWCQGPEHLLTFMESKWTATIFFL